MRYLKYDNLMVNTKYKEYNIVEFLTRYILGIPICALVY